MSTMTQKNVAGVAVGLDVAGEAIATVQITDSTLGTYIDDGQIIALGMGAAGEVVLPVGGTYATYPSIRLVERNGTQLNYSARIFGKDVLAWKGVAGALPTEQVSYVGYNGTTGSIDATGTNYIFQYINDWDDQMWSEQKQVMLWNYYSATATQLSIAQSFTAQINYTGTMATMQGTGPQVSAVMLSDGTTQSGLTGAPTLSITNGSDVITFSNTVATNGAAIGDVIRLGGAAAATTVAVYVIIAVPSTDSTLSASQVRIHTPFQGTSIAAGAEGVAFDRITGSTNYGIKLTGLPLTWSLPPFGDFTFKQVSFHLALQGFGSTSTSEGARASKGQGFYKTVAEMEYAAQGNEGALNRSTIPLPTGRHQTVTTTATLIYDGAYIESADTQGNSPITATVPMRIQNWVWIPDGSANRTKLLTQLNPWMISTPGLFPNIT